MRTTLVTILLLVLLIPVSAQSTCGDRVVVQQGDTLTAIGTRCNVSVDELIRLNPGTESVIDVGQTLRLPNYVVAQQPPILSVTPLSGGPGTDLAIAGNGFPAYVEVELRIGSTSSGTATTQRLITTQNGAIRATMTIPETAQVGETYLIIAETVEGFTNARSYPINVTFNRSNLFDTTTIYLIALGDAGVNGIGIGCRDSLVAVQVPIAPTVAPLTAGIRTLLASSTRTFPGTTYYNALNASDLRVDSVAIINRVAEIELSGNLVVGGACDVPRVQAQLELLATQYGTVDSVEVTVNGVPLRELLGTAPPTPAPTVAP